MRPGLSQTDTTPKPDTIPNDTPISRKMISQNTDQYQPVGIATSLQLVNRKQHSKYTITKSNLFHIFYPEYFAGGGVDSCRGWPWAIRSL